MSNLNGISVRNLLPVAEWARVRRVILIDGPQIISAGTYQEVAGVDGAIMATFEQGNLLFKIPIGNIYGLAPDQP